MKFTLKYLLQKLFVNDLIYKLYFPILYVSDRLKASRLNYINAENYARLKAKADEIFVDKIVCNGPFKGMKFNTEAAMSGSTYAMLLGSFESEIHPFIYTVLKNQYNAIINIGCAEGYYAIGFARLMPATIIKAYDTSNDALIKARALAEQNMVHKQISFLGTFYPQDVEKIDAHNKTLFIVDCEGAERKIFTKESASKLLNADLIIELHINLYPELEEYFRSIFADTHDIKIVNSVDDHLKAKQYAYSQLEGLDYTMRHFITEEREIFMQWMLLLAKNKV